MRKNNKFIIFIMIVIMCISIGYAVMNRELNITGNSEVKSNSWDIHFENVVVKEGSVEATNVPTIDSDKDSISFDVMLNLPGDFYEFIVDVKNSGTIDGMIESISKTPELTAAQAKYLKYEVSYQNGESINTKQNIAFGVAMPIKVRVEYRSDLNENDLPITNDALNLGLTLNYVQSDGTGTEVENNGKLIKIVSGTGTNVGDEVCIGEECFYVIGTESDNVNMLSKYNLHVGNSAILDEEYNATITPLTNPTGKQDINAKGWFSGGGTVEKPLIGVIAFSDTNYWKDISNEFSYYTYDSNAKAYSYVEDYKKYIIEDLGISVIEARLIKKEELSQFGCENSQTECNGAPEWVYSTSYWTGSGCYNDRAWGVFSSGGFGGNYYDIDYYYGVRPVISISKSIISD